MGKRLTDAERKKIIADYVLCQNYSEVARKHGLSASGVKKVVLEDPTCVEKCEEKANLNTIDTIEYIESQHELKKEILRDILKAIGDKAKKPDMFTNIRDLGTVYGILLDKELKFSEVKRQRETVEIENDGFIEALNATAIDMDWNGEDFDEQ